MYRKKILASLWMIAIQLRLEMLPDVLLVPLKHTALMLESHLLYGSIQSTMRNSKFYYKDILTYQTRKIIKTKQKIVEIIYVGKYAFYQKYLNTWSWNEIRKGSVDPDKGMIYHHMKQYLFLLHLLSNLLLTILM